MNASLNQLIKILIFTLIFPLIFLNLWLAFKFFHYFEPIVIILVLASLFAFILNYPVSILEKRGLQRNYAIASVFIPALVIILALAAILVPIVLEQFNEIAKLLPQWIDANEAKFQSLTAWNVSENLQVNIGQILTQLNNHLPDELQYLFKHLLSIIIDTIDSISEAIVTVVLTFYLLIDGQRIWEGIFKKLPGDFAQKIKNSVQQNFQNYLIGQVSLGLLMGVSETLMFLAFHVQFALLFGLGIGVLSLIPFGDVVSLIVVTLIIASHDFWLAVKVFAVAIVIDQLIDQAIAPRLLGKFTGLRPIWVIISLLIGTYIGGLLGLLIAVPLAGLIKDAADGFVSNVSSKAIDGEAVPEIGARG
ncbi:AI-2E family transporter [Calothrix sp. FACHB-1219]|uniref:AI-2E family transporter n=1 Tax=unclassified Calothrix TaxID=2619626 RepID=UPI001683B78F|nr:MULTISPECIES: AI-2E family transporter [unclassified Calothrix]MBD2204652.1 AI-2E family transporter [Calothrix sp. FACHB-168]MBD2216836.1 AI-2E family transporter [Calothrix sp. FACHB-1219]